MDDRAQAWIAHAAGARSVSSVRSLTHGISSSMMLVDVDGRLLVNRSYEGSIRSERRIHNEVRALAAARRALGTMVPELVAFDATGADAGTPSLVMTALPGQPVMFDLDVVQMAETLERLHAAPVPELLEVATPWFDAARLAVPEWTEDAAAWEQLMTMLERPAPTGTSVFLHRDLHHGNLLWSEGILSGVVDWATACTGPRGFDLAHTRSNLALVNGVDAADAFLSAYSARVVADAHDPWFDAAALVGHVQEAFVGHLAFNAFGARLDDAQLARRADDFARAIVARAE